MKNKNTEEVMNDILMAFVLFMGVCAGLMLVTLIALLVGIVIKAVGGIAFAAVVIFIVLAATITLLIRKHFLK